MKITHQKLSKHPTPPANTINMNLTCATGDSFVVSDLELDTDIIDMEAYAIAKICFLGKKFPFFCVLNTFLILLMRMHLVISIKM
ncbi:MAG: hypothetical protein Ct9H300mP4_10800 [Gammaproteobacteria bacterium]|nr:MAG: hypothetical protein Ct9H300mP4_10800 [Gammaproteobacteria bacterium]